MSHVYITGDTHGDFGHVERFCKRWNTTKDDLLIVLGDNGVNYWGPHRDKKLKALLEELPISFFFIKGNHDQRPSKKLYQLSMVVHPNIRGFAYIETEFPNLMFSEMYGYYTFLCNTKRIDSYVLGGAYSADKYYRLEMQAMGHTGYRWFPDEQMTGKEMESAFESITTLNTYHPYIILSHTCPLKYIPHDMCSPLFDPSTVDTTMEQWMDKVDEAVNYDRWFCGHWHTDRTIDKMRFMFHDIIDLEEATR